jgi:hypothetical protein
MTEQGPRNKMNCWEYMWCGRQPGGDKVSDLCECPAAVVAAYPDGEYNGGTCLGRRCWRMVGTLCGGEVQGIFAKKIGKCQSCPFYQKVKEEEGEAFME